VKNKPLASDGVSIVERINNRKADIKLQQRRLKDQKQLLL
jgi:hypothetical protein